MSITRHATTISSHKHHPTVLRRDGAPDIKGQVSPRQPEIAKGFPGLGTVYARAVARVGGT